MAPLGKPKRRIRVEPLPEPTRREPIRDVLDTVVAPRTPKAKATKPIPRTTSAAN